MPSRSDEIEHQSETEHIAGLRRSPTAENLRSGILRSASTLRLRYLASPLRGPKIANGHPKRGVNKHIRRLDIAVHEALPLDIAVHMSKRCDQLTNGD
jgi:hypothetical protein